MSTITDGTGVQLTQEAGLELLTDPRFKRLLEKVVLTGRPATAAELKQLEGPSPDFRALLDAMDAGAPAMARHDAVRHMAKLGVSESFQFRSLLDIYNAGGMVDGNGRPSNVHIANTQLICGVGNEFVRQDKGWGTVERIAVPVNNAGRGVQSLNVTEPGSATDGKPPVQKVR